MLIKIDMYLTCFVMFFRHSIHFDILYTSKIEKAKCHVKKNSFRSDIIFLSTAKWAFLILEHNSFQNVSNRPTLFFNFITTYPVCAVFSLLLRSWMPVCYSRATAGTFILNLLYYLSIDLFLEHQGLVVHMLSIFVLKACFDPTLTWFLFFAGDHDGSFFEEHFLYRWYWWPPGDHGSPPNQSTRWRGASGHRSNSKNDLPCIRKRRGNKANYQISSIEFCYYRH